MLVEYLGPGAEARAENQTQVLQWRKWVSSQLSQKSAPHILKNVIFPSGSFHILLDLL